MYMRVFKVYMHGSSLYVYASVSYVYMHGSSLYVCECL